jgi:cytochrome c oxidase assembly protein subunit 15
MSETLSYKNFNRWLWFSIIVTYLLILVGAAVRATGSGMGCPDWPKCFGQYIPPTDVSQLPSNYKEVFKVEGKTIADFDAFHTWVEYLNRLLGVIEGIAILGLLLSAFKIRKSNKNIWFSALFAFILVLIIGWVGSKVVSSNLAPAKITFHMIMALVLTFILLGMLYLKNTRKIQENEKTNKPFFYTILTFLILTLIQITIGTQVRQQVDDISVKLQNTHREVWIENLDVVFDAHKLVAATILFSFLAVYFKFRKKISKLSLDLLTLALVVIVLEFTIGDTIAHFMAAMAQPFHLFFANLLVGIFFYLSLLEKKS